jgi:hypothetical protein
MPVRVAREKFRIALRRILEKNLPDARLESLTAAAKLKDSFSDVYVRGSLLEGKSAWAIFAIRPGERAVTIKNSLAYGIPWLDWLRSRSTRHAIEGLRLIVPEESSALISDAFSASVHRRAPKSTNSPNGKTVFAAWNPPRVIWKAG